MIAEGSSSPHAPVPGGGPPEPGEPDLLAERRARRIAEPTETALLRRAEAAEATVRTLETHVASLQQRLRDTEGDTRLTRDLAERMERLETAVEAIRESHRRMAVTVGELRNVAVKLRVAAERPPEPANGRREEMAVALAAAVERLRARADASQPPSPEAQAPAVEEGSPQPSARAQAPAVEEPPQQGPQAHAPVVEEQPPPPASADPPPPAAAEPSQPDEGQTPPAPSYGVAPAAPAQAAEPAPKPGRHRHSMSLIARLLNRRKQRKNR
jgi:hypothetical protein